MLHFLTKLIKNMNDYRLWLKLHIFGFIVLEYYLLWCNNDSNKAICTELICLILVWISLMSLIKYGKIKMISIFQNLISTVLWCCTKDNKIINHDACSFNLEYHKCVTLYPKYYKQFTVIEDSLKYESMQNIRF